MVASWKTSSPPPAAKCSIQRGNLTRWSTDWATRSRRAPQSIAFAPGISGCGHRESDPLDRRAGVVPEVDPERALVVERGPNMHWLDVTRPSRICSGVRSETTVTS